MQKVSTRAILAALAKLDGLHNALVINNTAIVFEKNKLYFQDLLVEHTPYRQTFYVWELIHPLFHPNANLALNFSRRIGQEVLIKGSVAGVVDQVASCVRDDTLLIKRLFHPIDNEDFLALKPLVPKYPENFPNGVIFDVAVAMLLEKRLNHAEELLRHIWDKRSVKLETSLLHILTKNLLENIGNESSVFNIVNIVAKCNRGHMLAR